MSFAPRYRRMEFSANGSARFRTSQNELLTPVLQRMLLERKERIAFVNVDCDLFASAVPVFDFIEPLLKKDRLYTSTIISSGIEGRLKRVWPAPSGNSSTTGDGTCMSSKLWEHGANRLLYIQNEVTHGS